MNIYLIIIFWYCHLQRISTQVIDNGVSFKDKCLYAHNYVRQMHRVDDLRWEETLSQQSYRYALEISQSNTLKHSENADRGFYGENIYKGFSGFKYAKTVADAVYNWYIELIDYDYTDNEPNIHVVGHFTELVWRNTVTFGCGYASTEIYGGLMTYIVCQYQPGGNLQGLYIYNVLPPKDGAVIPSSSQILEAPMGCIDIIKACDSWSTICRIQVYYKLMMQYCRKTCKLC